MTQTALRGSVADGVYGGAKAVDHIGPPRHPHRVTIMQLARARETYELRWRELVRGDDSAVTRQRRRAPGGHSKAAAYERAEKVWRNLDRSGGYHGSPPVAAVGYRVTAHGLRHSFANWLKTAGVPTRDIQEALRHRDQRTTATYLHTSDGEKTRAINLLPSRR